MPPAGLGRGRGKPQQRRTTEQRPGGEPTGAASSSSKPTADRTRRDSGNGDDEPCGPVMTAPKTAPGTIGSPIRLATTAYPIEIGDDLIAFKYDLTFYETSANNRKTAELRMKGSNDHFASKRSELTYMLFAYLAQVQEKQFFGNFFAFTFDRRHSLYTTTALPIEDTETKSFHITWDKFAGYLTTDPDLKCVFGAKTPAQIKTDYVLPADVNAFKVCVKRCGDGYMVQPADMRPLLERDLSLMDRAGVQYLETIIAQNVYYNMQHITFGNRMFEADPRLHQPLGVNSGGGRRGAGAGAGGGSATADLANGLQRGVRLVEGVDGPTYVMQLDYKVSPFLLAQSVCDFMNYKFGLRKDDGRPYFDNGRPPHYHSDASAYLRDFAVQLRLPLNLNQPPRSFIAAGLSNQSAAVQTFEMNEPNGNRYLISVADYYMKRYNYTLRFPALPCVTQSRNDGRRNYYPMELCHLLPNQRLDLERARDYAAEMIRFAALQPPARKAKIEKLAREAGLFDNAFYRELGMSVSDQGMQLDGRVLPKPDVVYDRNAVVRPDESGGWRSRHHFIRGAKLQRLWVAVLYNQYDARTQHPLLAVPLPKLKAFLDAYTKRAREMGMKDVVEVTRDAVKETPDESDAIGQLVKQATAAAVPFILFIAPDNSDAHGDIKLHEVYGRHVITQQVNASTVSKCLSGGGRDGKPDFNCLENIVRKTNMKLGGINHDVDFSKLNSVLGAKYSWSEAAANRMFIGYDVAHPPPLPAHRRRRMERQTAPSVAGFCANTGEHAVHFVGSWQYVQTQREIDGSSTYIYECVRRQMQRWLAGRGRAPSELWFYRDGVAEGQYKQVLQYEVRDVRRAMADALKAVPNAPLPGLVFVVVTKRHNVKFYRDNLPELMRGSGPRGPRACDLNIPSGTTVDTTIVSPAFDEFFLNSHKTIQGTAHTPRYVVLLNEPAHSKDVLQTQTYALCFAHGIINAAVSLPAPVYAAHNLAKRGKLVHQADASSGISDDSALSDASPDRQHEGTSLDQLNSRLTFDPASALARHTFYA